MGRRGAGAALDYALPPRCPGCGVVVDQQHRFCLPCWSSLDFAAGPACRVCAEPFADVGSAGMTCPSCLADPPPFAAVHPAVIYGKVARAVAMRLKHGGRPGHGRTIALLMGRLAARLPADAILTPVPLHRWRIWRRGYNQAAVIGRAFALAAGLEFAPDLLVRRRHTPLLRGLGRRERAVAVRGAFAAAPHARDRIGGRPVVLVDDVFTSGATARACARVLRRAGAPSVDVLCWARVGRDPADTEGAAVR